MKVVLNRAVGKSFCLSAKAVARFVQQKKRSGEKLSVPPADQNAAWVRDIRRNDLDLVRVVEELGAEAAASEAELVIVEIDDSTPWHISEVVGYEFVVAGGKVH